MARTFASASLVLTLAACDAGEPAPSPSPAPGQAVAAHEAEPPGEAKVEQTPAGGAPTATLGEAPTFELQGLDGKTHRLADHAGKVVVLEWFNPECPFVKFAHGEGPLKDMAARYSKDGVVWLAINSGAKGRQGHGAEKNKKGAEAFGMAHPILFDEDGTVGKAYGAEKTPHMYIVDENGQLLYRGAIDNAPFGKTEGGAEHQNFVDTALADYRAGRPIATPETAAYGCSVKYPKT